MTLTKIPFTKMHGLGNNYIYLNCLEASPENPEDLAIKVSDRNFGIGSDGLVLIMGSEQADFRMRMFNSDGSEAQMCGNAVRCVAKYLYEKNLTKLTSIKLETKAGIKILNLKLKNNLVTEVSVDMGAPILKSKLIPVASEEPQLTNYPIEFFGEQFKVNAVSMGNPHLVIFVPEITDRLVLQLGPKIEHHPLFPERINVEFAKIINRQTIAMRVWERGSGETQACGTGACAVAVASALNNLSDRQVTIKLLGGDLDINWQENDHVIMTGPAEFVCDGEFYY